MEGVGSREYGHEVRAGPPTDAARLRGLRDEGRVQSHLGRAGPARQAHEPTGQARVRGVRRGPPEHHVPIRHESADDVAGPLPLSRAPPTFFYSPPPWLR